MPLHAVKNVLKPKLFLIFAAIYAAISLVNHYFFRTYALDLGVYTNALWDYSHFQFNDSTTFKENPENLLADHFDLMLPLISPFCYLFGTYTLLIFQLLAIYAGGRGLQKFIFSFTQNENTAWWARLYFSLHFGVYAALSFDYHSNVVAACLFPWFAYYVYEQRKIPACILLGLMLITKENTSLWLFTSCVVLPFVFKREQFFLLTCAGVCFFYFLLVTQVIMPALSLNGQFAHFKYSVLGNDYLEAVSALFIDPVTVFKTLFINHTGDVTGNYVKTEFWLFFLLSGGFLIVFRPLWLLIMLPLFFQKMFHDQVQMWGVNSQYSIELAPFMAMAIFTYPYIWKEKANRPAWIYAAFSLVALTCTVRLMDNTVTHVPKENLRIYQAKHYQYDFDKNALLKALEKIPDTAAVSCSSFLVPHLALRNHIYQFPITRDARYILLVDNDRTYPLDKWVFKDELLYYLNRRVKFEVLYAQGNVFLFYRRDN